MVGVKHCNVYVELFHGSAPSAVGVWQCRRFSVFNISACIAVTICCIPLEFRRIAVRMQKFLPAPTVDYSLPCPRLFTVLAELFQHLEYVVM